MKIGSSCVHYDGEEPLDNLEVVQGEDLTSILKKINDLDMTGTEEGHVNIGGGAEVYKQKNLLGETELRTITSSDSSVEIIETSSTIDIKTDSKQIVSSDNTLSIDEGVNEVDLKVNSKQIVSSDGSITINHTPTTIDISYIPEAYTDVPRYIVNNLYTGQDEQGTYSKPYKTIEAALLTFQGNGTRNSPQRANATIVIQKGSVYNFTGDFTYRNLNIVIEEGAQVNHQPQSGGWLIDYNLIDNTKSKIQIELKGGALLRMYQKGIRNRGSTAGSNGAKEIRITGTGTMHMAGAKQAGYTMFEANYDNQEGYAMPTYQNFTVRGLDIISDNKDIWNIGVNTAVIFEDCSIKHSYKGVAIDPLSESFYQKGGSITLTRCNLHIGGVRRENCFILEKQPNKICNFILESCTLIYPDEIANLFYRRTEENARVECQYLSTTNNMPLEYVFGIEHKNPWTNLYFNYNIIKGGEICELASGSTPLADLTNNNTTSVTNNVGGIEKTELTTHSSKSAALSALGRSAIYILDPDGNPANKSVEITII